jgi:hypothetical protein
MRMHGRKASTPQGAITMTSLLIEVNLFSVNDSHLCSGRKKARIEYDGCALEGQELQRFLDTTRIYLTNALTQLRPHVGKPKLTGFTE